MRGVSANPPAAGQSVSELKPRIEAERTGLPFLIYRDAGDNQQIFSFEPALTQASVGRRGASDLVLDAITLPNPDYQEKTVNQETVHSA